MRSRALAGLIVLALFGGVACSIETVQQAVSATDDDNFSDTEFDQSDRPPPRSAIAEIVASALPSVVNVKVITAGQVGLGRGEGSGVVIDEAGVILTNFHVVECSANVQVVFNDEEHGKMTGTVIGGIPEKDLAVIEVEADDLVPIEIGRSSELLLGDDVVAIGFPLGLGGSPTVTRGIVSALDRTIEAGASTGEERRLEGLLQTDAAINPGNSGGALIDRGGRLVGINTAAAQAAQAENIGFAIAIDEALPTVEDILNKPAEDRAWLGVSVDSIDSAFEAADLGLDEDVRGAGVALAFPGDPAEVAGIEKGDVIVGIEGQAIRSGQDLTDVLGEFEPREEVEVEVVSPDGSRTETVTLGTRPPENVISACE